MKETLLLNLCLAVSAVGIISLLFSVPLVQPRPFMISQLNSSLVGSTVAIEGMVLSVSSRNTTTLIEIAQLQQVPVMIFSPNSTLLAGDYVQVTGTFEEYQETPTIVAEEIMLR